MTPTRWILLAALAVGIAAPDRAADPPKDPNPPKEAKPAVDGPRLAAEARRVLETACRRCHQGDGSSSGRPFDATSLASLLKPSGKKSWVAPNDLAKSKIWEKVEDGSMPEEGSDEAKRFGDPEKAALKAWILAGAPPFPTDAPRRFVSLKDVLTAMRKHQAKADPADRPFLRFFSLTHLHNDPGVSAANLRETRAAMSKVLNSLSWAPDLVIPEAIDPEQTMFAFDLRAVEWDRQKHWNRLVKAYPYGLKFFSHPDPTLKQLDAELSLEAGSELPWLRADWFVVFASRPPLYHDLLGLPDNAAKLEKDLGVDISANFGRNTLRRAGFSVSGVSGQNRLIERHAAAKGAYLWKSYDFLFENGRGHLIRFPLGPTFAGNRFDKQAFRHDGGEIIFGLPNGLQGYYLVNGKDERIDAGPIDVVSDEKRVSGTPAILNGISCMACHTHGILDNFSDQIRDGAAVFGDAADKVRLLYPEDKEMKKLTAKDRERFVAALEKTVLPFLQDGEDKAKPADKLLESEPVSAVAKRYRRGGYVNLRTAAAELFFEKPEQLLAEVGAQKFKELGLGALARDGGQIGRSAWEASDGGSLMQNLARAVGFTPFGR